MSDIKIKLSNVAGDIQLNTFEECYEIREEHECQLKNGNVIEGEAEVKIFRLLLQLRPHRSALNFRWNDIGLGNLFGVCFKDVERFCIDNQKWYVYDGRVWWKDKGDVLSQGNMQVLLQLLHLYVEELTGESDEEDDLLKKYDTYIHKSSSDVVIRRALNAAKNSMIIELTDFDSNPYLLNCTNGVYDLETHTFRDSVAEDYFTLSTACPYLPEGLVKRCDRWYTFIDEITSGDKEKAEYLQKALGYSLLGENKLECMFVAYGRTRCGKGTLFNTVAKVLGMGKRNGYGGTVKSALVCESKFKDKDYNAPEPMLADTVGIRYLTLSETKEKMTLDEAAIKSLTGRDPLKTRQLHSEAFTFTPQFTIWLSTNFLPRVNDNSVFKSDRIWVIPFNEHYEEGTRDEGLKELFLEKNSTVTVLRWLIEGYEKYAREGLIAPKSVREATEQYERISDRILCFKEDCLEDAPGERVSNALLYARYKSWCMNEERGYTPFGTTTFYKKLSKFYPRKDANGFRGFVDVKLKAASDEITIT